MIRYEFLITDQTSGPKMKGENLGPNPLKIFQVSIKSILKFLAGGASST